MARPPQLLSKRDYSAEITALFELYDGASAGTLFTYTRIEEATKLRHNVSPWGTIISKFKRLYLQQRGIALRTERGVGYRSLTTQQQLEDDLHRRRAQKALQRDFAEKVYIKDENMSDEQQRLQAALTHQDTKMLETARASAIERKTFLASVEGVQRYMQTNAVRPRAILIQEEEETQAVESGQQPPPPAPPPTPGESREPRPRPRPRTS